MAIGWRFSRSSTDEGRSGGNPSEYTFDHDLKDFVRETLQNSNDAGADVSGTTEVTFKLRELTGSDLDEFTDAIQWGDGETDESLRKHVESASDTSGNETINNVLNEIDGDEEAGKLLIMTVEDKNTHGLYGPEGGEGPFSALVLDELITEKAGGSAGGSYGLGKAVLWSWSGLKTVFFSSVPETTNGNEPPRVIARSQLPYHESDSDAYRYEGHGLFGDVTGSNSLTAVGSDNGDVLYKWGDGSGRPYSVWGAEAAELASQLGMERNGTPGTSVSVLGFCEPGGSGQEEPNDIADRIATEASKWFWPAMLRGDLEVYVQVNGDREQVEPDACESVQPFIQCVQKRNETREVLEQPGDVGLEQQKFEIEDLANPVEGEDGTTEDGPINIYVRLADPDTSDRLDNHVALIRGAGMVVKYYNRNRIVYGGRTFHGVVLAGEARSWTDSDPTEADSDIEDYLQTAEPPRHSDWEYTMKLKSVYEQGAKGTVNGLQRNLITDAIKDLIRQTREEGRLVAGRLANRLNIPEGRGSGGDSSGGGGGGGSQQVFDGTSEIEFNSSEDRWSFSGFAQVTADEWEFWEVSIELERVDEEGKVVGTVPIDEIHIPSNDVWYDDSGDKTVVRGDGDVESFNFNGSSDQNPIRGETRVEVSGKVGLRRFRT